MDAEGGPEAKDGDGGDAVRAAALDPADVLRLDSNPHAIDDFQERGQRQFAFHTGFLFRLAPTADAGGSNNSASLFLSLILLVLAFFIVMVSMSSIDAERSAGVIGSVAATFAPDVPRAPSLVPQGAQRGDVVDGEDLEQSLKRLFAMELAVAEFRSVRPGRVLEIEMAGDVLFHRDQARLRVTHSQLLDRLVATLTLRPPGQRVDVQVMVSTRTPNSSSLPTSSSALAVNRAGALGDVLIRRGLPRQRLAVGLWSGEADRIVLVFSIAAAEGKVVPYPAAFSAEQGQR